MHRVRALHRRLRRDHGQGRTGPRKLIAYDSFRNLKAEAHGDRAPLRLIRPRTILYAAAFALVATVMLFGLTHKTVLDVNVVPDRNPLFVQV